MADTWNNSNSSCGVHKIHVLKHRDEMAVLSETWMVLINFVFWFFFLAYYFAVGYIYIYMKRYKLIYSYLLYKDIYNMSKLICCMKNPEDIELVQLRGYSHLMIGSWRMLKPKGHGGSWTSFGWVAAYMEEFVSGFEWERRCCKSRRRLSAAFPQRARTSDLGLLLGWTGLPCPS